MRKNSEKHIQNIHQWIVDSVQKSSNDWLTAVFKISSERQNRQVITTNNLSQFLTALHWTIGTTRRRYKSPTLKFVPYLGGDKENQVAIHIHALLEQPTSSQLESLTSQIQKDWQQYCVRALKCQHLYATVWTDQLDKTRIRAMSSYCTRYEGKTFLWGQDKVLTDHPSFML